MEPGKFVFFLLGLSLVLTPACGDSDRDRDALLKGTFPDDFIWSSASAAYQIEGAWNVSGKGPSVWDTLARQGNRYDTGDVACDSYHKYPEDVQLMKQMGLKYYRFSISWPRLFPTGEQQDGVNQDGVDYYNNLINELQANGIEPMVTLFHWDLPQVLQDRYGGFLNNHTNSTVIHDLFGDYARFCYRNFGDRVKYWITFNDPWIIALEGYGIGTYPPLLNDPAEGQYIAGHNIILAHAKAYHIYNNEFRAAQNGKVSIALSCDWGEPKFPHQPASVAAAERYVQFFVGWFAHPVYKNGDYPEVMKATLERKGQEEGRNSSRLPEFTPQQKAYINRTADFFALNFYTTVEVEDAGHIVTDNPSYFTDMDVVKGHAADWQQSPFGWLYVVPWGIRKVLGFIRDEYGNPDVFITENGRPDHDRDPPILMDMDRICTYMMYTNEVMKARNLDNVKVKAYTAWSLLDGFEWMPGYSVRFGLYYVDFNDPERTRYPKASSVFYKQLVRNNGFPEGSEFTRYVETMWDFCHNTREPGVRGRTGGASQISSLFSLFLAMPMMVAYGFIA